MFALGDGVCIALADGAGGTGGGAIAAQAVIDAVAAAVTGSRSIGWTQLLIELDRERARLGHGQTTAIVLHVDRHGIEGDSGAWLVQADGIADLTADQQRKPLLGSGATPIAFRAGPLRDATLLVASDGLLRYARRRDIMDATADDDLARVARALVEVVRLPSGDVQDDISMVLCRCAAR